MTISAAIAANRFGLGAKPGDLDRIGVDGRGWVEQALRQPSRMPAALAGLPDGATIVAGVLAARRNKDPAAGARIREIYVGEAGPRLQAAIDSDQPVQERLVQFWANHFTVSAYGKPLVGAFAGAFEREAIRPHILGRFADLLRAAVSHPAMLIYLDNARSVGPNSPVGLRTQRGLNENLAREVLELHSLGVAGGYTQADVIAFAKILTGWTIAGENQPQPGGFRFAPAVHEPGEKILLGRRYDQGGIAEGDQALADLARHPATARHVATKLARHFIADHPPEAAVARLTTAFQDSDGHLGVVIAALAALPVVWATPLPKLKSPQDLVTSSFRALGGYEGPAPQLVRSLAVLDQPLFAAPSPAGWPDAAENWIGPESSLRRLAWLHSVATKAERHADPVPLGQAALGPLLAADTRTVITRAPSVADGLALLLASPEFQRR